MSGMDEEKPIKCVVWDLDSTLWDGVLLEGDPVAIPPAMIDVITTLDQRGILHSIASKNEHQAAMEKIREFGLDEFFLFPEINWNAKSSSIARIRDNFNIDAGSMMFVDDEQYERDEVQSVHADILCVDARDRETLLSHPRLNPRFVTEDSGRRRQMYLAQFTRKRAEEGFSGPRSEFLASMRMRLSITRATEMDLQRAEELTIRTNQLNTTGRTYAYEELKGYLGSAQHDLLICELEDRYGAYGKIGLALVEKAPGGHRLRLFLMSCRVMSLGLGSVFLTHILRRAKRDGDRLRADFRHTGRNRQMYVAFKLANFKDVESPDSDGLILEHDLSALAAAPPYLELTVSVPDR